MDLYSSSARAYDSVACVACASSRNVQDGPIYLEHAMREHMTVSMRGVCKFKERSRWTYIACNA